MAEDTMLQEAIAAIEAGDKAKAKDLLTRLLKVDQSNATYWVWMSAAVETVKERIYCLQTALRLDPENAAAKRGLILSGALPPDETIQPFPLNRQRQWEEELEVAKEANKPKGFKALVASPAARLAGVLVLVGAVIWGGASFLLAPRTTTYISAPTQTAGPSPTFTLTPTFVNATSAPVGTPAESGPTPLWMLLDATYTPTPIYVNTPHGIESRDIFNAVQRASQRENWGEVITYLQQAATLEPQSADPYYYMGEAYMRLGDAEQAQNAYTQAISLNPAMGPAYVGLARAKKLSNPGADVLPELNAAIAADPNYPNAYLERAGYLLDSGNPQAAMSDIQSAQQLAPDSPLISLYYAQVYFDLGDNARGLAFAERAYQQDITLLPVYRLLGEGYIKSGQSEKALGYLQTYTQYEPRDAQALMLTGAVYNEMKDYETALKFLDRSVQIDNRLGEAYLQRGIAYVGLKKGPNAEYEFKTAQRYFPKSFDVTLGLIHAAILQSHYGDAYLAADTLETLAETDEQLAEVYYWRGFALEKLDRHKTAIADWKALQALPKGVVPAERLAEAEKYIKTGITPTVTPTATRMPTGTKKPGSTTSVTTTVTPTPTPTPKPK